MKMKKIIKFIINIPNFPFAVIIGIYLFIELVHQSGFQEVIIKKQTTGTVLTEEIKDYMTRIYPRSLKIFIAVVFYSYITFRLFL